MFTGVAGTPWYSNIYFDATDEPGVQSAHAQVTDFWQAIGPQMNSAVDFTVEAEVPLINVATGIIEAVFTEAPTTGGGSNSATLAPPATQGLIRANTNVFIAGRRLKGHVFIPGLTEESWAGVLMEPGHLTLLETAADLLLDPGATATWVVWSRTHGQAHPVLSASAVPKGGVLRSRRD